MNYNQDIFADLFIHESSRPKEINPNRDEEESRSSETAMIKLDEQRLPTKKAEAQISEIYWFLEAHLWVMVKIVQLKQSRSRNRSACTEEDEHWNGRTAGIKCPEIESNSAPDSLPTLIPAQQMGKNNGLLCLQRPVIIN